MPENEKNNNKYVSNWETEKKNGKNNLFNLKKSIASAATI